MGSKRRGPGLPSALTGTSSAPRLPLNRLAHLAVLQSLHLEVWHCRPFSRSNPDSNVRFSFLLRVRGRAKRRYGVTEVCRVAVFGLRVATVRLREKKASLLKVGAEDVPVTT
mmetsp:Transcript_52910/g.103473  ORF Transcript_52910/g.103473 Transcript_52910/m.103473 type:complete len:112 (-) Transcript_52910:228-563(-)